MSQKVVSVRKTSERVPCRRVGWVGRKVFNPPMLENLDRHRVSALNPLPPPPPFLNILIFLTFISINDKHKKYDVLVHIIH